MPYTSKIIEIIPETHDTKSYKFEKPEGFQYSAGQYGIFEFKMGNDLIRRSYSFSSSPTEPFLQITVKLIPGGRMSGYLHGLACGDMLIYNAPIGKFVFEDYLKDVAFIAGGSGISPFRGMIKYILDKNLKTKVSLIYGSRSPRDIIMREQLEFMMKSHEHIKLFFTVDHPDNDWKFHTGFIDKEVILEAIGNNLRKEIYFLIGPPMMVTSVKNSLLSLNVDEQNIRIDAWG